MRIPGIRKLFRRRTSSDPGDTIRTGTTCRLGLEEGRFLNGADAVETEIDEIGVLRSGVGAQGRLG